MLDYQTAKEWIIGLEAFRGHDLEEYSALVEPLSKFVSNNKFYNLYEVNELVKGILAAGPETTTMEIEPSVTSQFLTDQIKPWVEDIRQTLFHSKSTPFGCIEDAQKWCDESEKGIDKWYRRVDEWHRRADEWHKRCDEYDEHWEAMRKKYPLIEEGIDRWETSRKEGILVDLPTQEELRQLKEIKRSLDLVKPGKSPELDEQAEIYNILWDKIIEVIKATGFTAASVKMHILANTPLVLPSLSYGIIDRTHSLPSGASIVNRFARITIRSDLTFEELRSAYLKIRRELGIKRSKCPTTKHLQLYQMVTERGGTPSGKGTVAFWKAVRQDWNKKHPKDKYTTWKGVKVAYDRIYRKMVDRFQVKKSKGGTK